MERRDMRNKERDRHMKRKRQRQTKSQIEMRKNVSLLSSICTSPDRDPVTSPPSTLPGFSLDGMAMDRPDRSNEGQALLPTGPASKFRLSEQLEGQVGTYREEG